MVVDTGATSVAMSVAEAQRLGVEYRSGQPIQMSTANGVIQGWIVSLSSARATSGNGVEAVLAFIPYVQQQFFDALSDDA